MKSIRYLFTWHMFLAIVAVQVFQQVWNLAVGEPLSGFILSLWICWKLGCLASLADWYDRWDHHAKEIQTDIDGLVEWFESLPADARIALTPKFEASMAHVTTAHQKVLVTRDGARGTITLRDAFPRLFRRSFKDKEFNHGLQGS